MRVSDLESPRGAQPPQIYRGHERLALNRKPQTLNLKPETLNPKPQTRSPWGLVAPSPIAPKP